MRLEVLLFVVCASGGDCVNQGFCNPGILVPKKKRKLNQLYHPHHMFIILTTDG
jgi:hypothetical protein